MSTCALRTSEPCSSAKVRLLTLSSSTTRLWEPFFTTKERGRGLGLPSVLGILRAHHAGIALESHPRAGTQFRVYFSEDPASEPQGRSMPG